MTRDEYWDDLMIALQANDLDGRQVGQIVAELAAHVEDSAADPRTELGDPFELAEALAGRRGPAPSTRWRFVGFLVAFQIAAGGLFGLTWPDVDAELLSISWSEFGAVVLAVGLGAWWFSLLLTRGTTGDLTTDSPSVSDRFLGFGLLVLVAVPILAAIFLPSSEAFAGSRTLWWSMLTAGSVYAIVELILARRHRRLVLPMDAPRAAETSVVRSTGMKGLATGWRTGRRIHKR